MSQSAPWRLCLLLAIGTYFVSSALVFAAASLGPYLRPAHLPSFGYLDALANFDGHHYCDIVNEGYSYDPSQPSLVAFFPLYPLCGWAASRATGLPATGALVITANLFFLGALMLLAFYWSSAEGDTSEAAPRASDGGLALAAFALFPTSFFFRMAYSESCFVFFAVASLLAMRRRWPLVAVALLVGAATATRPVGIALLPPFLAHIWRHAAPNRRLLILFPLMILSCWGIIAYGAFLGMAFGDPFVFAKTQANWNVVGQTSLFEKCGSLLGLEPIWMPYKVDYAGYWGKHGLPNPIMNLQFSNPILFVAVALLVACGAIGRRLSLEEVLLSAGLLAIPYLTRAHEMCLLSHGRFSSVVFPAFLLLGAAIRRLPLALAASIWACTGFLLGLYSALFAAGAAFF